MSLKEQIASQMDAITETDKKVMSECLLGYFKELPTGCVRLQSGILAKNAYAKYWGGTQTIQIPETKIDSAKRWLESEGFVLEKQYTPRGYFAGYKIFLDNEYKDL